MFPRLLALAGPLKDSTVSLGDGETTVGREPTNTVVVIDPSVSRHHCTLQRDSDGRFRIKDLESRNGTVVNGARVTEQWLQHGDQISVGDSIFLFQTEDRELTPSAPPLEFDETRLTAETTVIYPPDVVYLHPQRLLQKLQPTAQVTQNLSALLKISRIVHAIRDLDELQKQLLELIFEVIPAERGAILLSENAGPEFGSFYARTRQSGQARQLRVSRTIVCQVMKENVAILGIDVPSGKFRNVESLADAEVHSLLCVPLAVFHKTIGCIYLDSTTSGSRFTEDHLQLTAAVAGVSAVALDNARRLQWLEQENLRLTMEVSQEHTLVGESVRMKEIYQFLAKVAPSDSTVLIEGESGTGKELAARALHRNSPRSSRPFVAINCAAIPEALLESDLFGHERGAFTGAATQKKGRLEVADGGVVFLDEIGELAPALQVKLLRVLQEREFERVGGTRPVKIDIRLVAATNRDLQDAVRKGEFRQDLYYRLAVVKLTMPPLREHKDDIPALTRHFVQKYAKRCNVKAKPVSPEAMCLLSHYDWPGNIRELENAVERALVLGSSDVVLVEDLPESLLEHASTDELKKGKYHAKVKDVKKELILSAVEQTRGNYVEAAAILGVHPNYLHRLIRNLELKDALNELLRPGLPPKPPGRPRVSGGAA